MFLSLQTVLGVQLPLCPTPQHIQQIHEMIFLSLQAVLGVELPLCPDPKDIR